MTYKRIFKEEEISPINDSPGYKPEVIDSSNLTPYIRQFGVENTAKALIANEDQKAIDIMKDQGQDWETVKYMPNTVGVVAAELQPEEKEDEQLKPDIQQNQNATVIVNNNA